MKRLISLVVTLIFGLQPAFALAAFETPSALLDAISKDGAARTIKGELHGNMNTTWASVWFDIAQEGIDLHTGKARVKATVDVVDTAQNMKGRIKLEMLGVENRAFMKIDHAEGTFEDDQILASAKIAMKKWIELPVDEDAFALIEAMQEEGDSSAANQVFALTHVLTSAGHSYTLTLKPELLAAMPGMNAGESVNLTATINTNAADIFQNGKMTFTLKADAEGVNAHGTATMQRSKAPLTITAPADAVSIDQLFEQWADIGSNPLDSYLDFPNPEFPSEEWELPAEEWDIEEPEIVVKPVVPSVQRGIKPSRRTIRETVRTQREATRPTVKPRNTSSSTLDDRGLVMGRSDAPVTIVEFGDYECPFCARHFELTMPQIMKNYVNTGKVRYVFRNFPLSFHPGALPAAIAVECALKQGNVQAVELHDLIYTAVNGGLELTMENIRDWAETIGEIRMSDFNTCTDEEETADRVDADIREGTAAGVSGTPSFFIIGSDGEVEQITGAYPFDEFESVIERMLEE